MPQFYLRAFADSKERVRVYDSVSRKASNQRISNVAVESNLYTVVNMAGNPSDEVEGLLSRVEGFVATRLSTLFESEPAVSMGDRQDVATFIALQFVRTAAMRAQLEDVHDLHHRMLIEANVGGDPAESVERFIEKQYADTSEAFKQQVREVAADPDRSIRLSNVDWLARSFELLPHLTDELLARR